MKGFARQRGDTNGDKFQTSTYVVSSLIINANPFIGLLFGFEELVANDDELKSIMLKQYNDNMKEYRYTNKAKFDEAERFKNEYSNKLGIQIKHIETTIGPSNH